MKFSSEPIPLPPATNTLASDISTISLCSLIISTIFVLISLELNFTSTFSTVASFSPSGSFSKTPGLTVAICGLWSGHTIVAIKLPPNAGLVANKSPLSTSTSKDVQSAVKPVSNLAATLGPKSLPMNVAPMKIIFGFLALANSHIAFVYPSVV